MVKPQKSIAIVRKEPKRSLYWDKSVYHLWFDYAKASPRNIPVEFGNLDNFSSFEEWWSHPDYGFQLFCEPEEDDPLEVQHSNDQLIPLPNVYVTAGLYVQIIIDVNTTSETCSVIYDFRGKKVVSRN